MSVYFIAEDFDGDVKIGFATKINRRIIQLQTGNPRTLKLMAYIQTESAKEDRKIEKALHKKYEKYKVQKEWYSIRPDQVVDEIRHYPYDGFLAKSKDALKILGYDHDGIPEVGEVWDWDSLYWDECCPFCGCICGLVYEENVMMHRCLNCGYHLLDDGTAEVSFDQSI